MGARARGNLPFDTRQMNEAEAAFREAITLDPSSLPVRSSLAAALANRLVSEGNAHQRAGNAAAQRGVETLRQVLGP